MLFFEIWAPRSDDERMEPATGNDGDETKMTPDTERSKLSLLKLLLLARELKASGGQEERGELFEEFIAEQTSLLECYALPPATEYLELIDVERVWGLSDAALDALLQTLSAKSAEYATTKLTTTDIDVLKRAALERADPFDVLPRLGILTHGYTLFVFDELVRELNAGAGDAEVCAALAEMHEAWPCLDELGIIEVRRELPDDHAAVWSRELPHLDLFLSGLGLRRPSRRPRYLSPDRSTSEPNQITNGGIIRAPIRDVSREHARVVGPMTPGTFRVVVIESDRRLTHLDFSSLEDAKQYADDAAAEADDEPPIAHVFDAELRVVHVGTPYDAPTRPLPEDDAED